MTRVRVLSHLGEMPGVAAAVPEVVIEPIPFEGALAPEVRGDVLLTLMQGAPNLTDALDRGVRWVHAVGTGVDAFPLDALGGRVLTCSRGVNAANIAEWVMAQMLCVVKRLPDAWVHEPPSRWGQVELGTLVGSRLAIVGLGAIGTALARRALAFDMDVVALRRTDAPSPLAGVRVVRSVAELVAGADHVVLAAPSTAATRGMVDAGFLAALPRGAHLVNVARGDLVDEPALRAALDSGQLAVASIDVATQEPLPAGHWLYSHPSVRFSPHVSWSGPGLWEANERVFVENLRRWLAGDALTGVVDVDAGY